MSDRMLIALCASHINNTHRLQCLLSMIKSWREQTLQCKLFISLSYDTVQITKKILLQSLPSCEDLHINIRDCPLRQFEHYKMLSDEVSLDHTDAFVIFSDDDDVWHPDRVKTFSKCLRLFQFGLLYMYCPMYAEQIEKRGTDDVMTSHGVTIHLEKGEVKTIEEWTGYGNYVSYVLNIKTLLAFMQQCPPYILSHKFCDMFFLKFIRLSLGQQYAPIPTDNWMYYYRHGGQTDSVTFTNQYETLCNESMEKWLAKLKKKWNVPKNFVKSIVNRLELHAMKRTKYNYQDFMDVVLTCRPSSVFIRYCQNNERCIQDFANSPYIVNLFKSPIYKDASVV